MLLLRLKKVKSSLYEHSERIASTHGIESVNYNSDLLRYYGVTDNDNLRMTLFSLAAIIMAVIIVGSIALIYNAFAISVSEQEEQLILLMSVFIYGFITLISLISIANIFNTISTSISLRKREFAMLRSIGMTPKGFNKMINYESIFYGVKALAYGLPIIDGLKQENI